MKNKLSQRLRSLGNYAFAEVDKKVQQLRQAKVDVIDFGVGDPTTPTPRLIREAAQRAVDRYADAGYPSYIGSARFRSAVGDYVQRRFGVHLDPEKEITSTIGSKEAIFNLHEGILDPGDVLLVPNPGYPPYSRGAKFAEAVPYYYPLLKENDFLPDLDSFPSDILAKAKAMWINYPNSPTGQLAPDSFYEKLVKFARQHDLLLLSDEAYSEIYFDSSPPRSLLEFGKEGILVVNSLSKRSAMTGYRIGWAGGDPELVECLRKVKTNIDSGAPEFVQEAAIAALQDEEHVAQMRQEYKEKRDLLVGALTRVGMSDCSPQSTLYLWQEAPRGMNGSELAQRLLDSDLAIVTTPGPAISETPKDGRNPGDNFVRFALVPSLERVREAARRIEAASW